MSKAFINEDRDNAPELSELGSRFGSETIYLTPDGARRIETEIGRIKNEQAGATQNASLVRDSSPPGEMERLEELLRRARIVPPPPPQEQDRVQFGAVVTVEENDGGNAQYRIVGRAEVDLDRNWVSQLSPIGRALLNKRAGDVAIVNLASGGMRLKVLQIDYLQPAPTGPGAD